MSESIMHYGVKGMKWGVRKQRPTSSGKRKGKTRIQSIRDRVFKKKSSTKEVKVENPSQRKRASEMSDDELRRVINRMQMERAYSQLTAKEISKGRKFVNDVLYASTKTVATQYTTKAMMKAVEKLLRSSGGSGGSGSGGGSGGGST